jgi:hypothetical protein
MELQNWQHWPVNFESDVAFSALRSKFVSSLACTDD